MVVNGVDLDNLPTIAREHHNPTESRAVERGMRYKCWPKDGAFAALYVKTIQNVVMVLRDLYPEHSFHVVQIAP